MATRTRVSFKFWLNPRNPEERRLMDDIEVLKHKKRFTQTIRDGIRLISSLREGRLDVLRQMFPWVWDQVALEIEKNGATSPPHNDLKNMQAMLSRIDTMLSQQPLAIASPTKEGGAQRALHAPQALDELRLDIKQQSRDADNNPTWNFMIASTLQIYGKCDVLPSEIIAYGLRTKRIPPHAVTQPPKQPPETATGGPKAMDVPQFAPPSFDDDEDLLNL